MHSLTHPELYAQPGQSLLLAADDERQVSTSNKTPPHTKFFAASTVVGMQKVEDARFKNNPHEFSIALGDVAICVPGRGGHGGQLAGIQLSLSSVVLGMAAPRTAGAESYDWRAPLAKNVRPETFNKVISSMTGKVAICKSDLMFNIRKLALFKCFPHWAPTMRVEQLKVRFT
jgi:hypothetical protein